MSREEGKAVGERNEEVGRRRKGEVGSSKEKKEGRRMIEGMERKKQKYTHYVQCTLLNYL
jgi:hypothetical protein